MCIQRHVWHTMNKKYYVFSSIQEALLTGPIQLPFYCSPFPQGGSMKMSRAQLDSLYTIPMCFLQTRGLKPTCVFHLGSHLCNSRDLLLLGGMDDHHGASGHTDHTA